MLDPRFDSWFQSTHPGNKASWELDDYEDTQENTEDDDDFGVSL